MRKKLSRICAQSCIGYVWWLGKFWYDLYVCDITFLNILFANYSLLVLPNPHFGIERSWLFMWAIQDSWRWKSYSIPRSNDWWIPFQGKSIFNHGCCEYIIFDISISRFDIKISWFDIRISTFDPDIDIALIFNNILP